MCAVRVFAGGVEGEFGDAVSGVWGGDDGGELSDGGGGEVAGGTVGDLGCAGGDGGSVGGIWDSLFALGVVVLSECGATGTVGRGG